MSGYIQPATGYFRVHRLSQRSLRAGGTGRSKNRARPGNLFRLNRSRGGVGLLPAIHLLTNLLIAS